MAEQQTERNKGAGCIVAGTLVVVLLPLFYVLSLGPAVWLVNHNDWLPLPWVVAFYFPLEWLADQNQSIKNILDAYVEFWK